MARPPRPPAVAPVGRAGRAARRAPAPSWPPAPAPRRRRPSAPAPAGAADESEGRRARTPSPLLPGLVQGPAEAPSRVPPRACEGWGGRGLGGADQAVHPGVLPLHRDRPVVPDGVEHPEACLPRHVPVPGGDEVPATP